MKNPEKYIINNPFVKLRYASWLTVGLMLAVISALADRFSFHIRLAKTMINQSEDLRQYLPKMIETGHLTLQILVCIGIILTMAFMTPFMVSAFAATRINRYNKEHHR